MSNTTSNLLLGLIVIAAEMRERRVNHGRTSSPTLEGWSDRIQQLVRRLETEIAKGESPADQDLVDLAGRLLHASVSVANAKPQPADGAPRWDVGVMEEAVTALRGAARATPVLKGWSFHRDGEQVLACGPDGGGWLKRSGSLWQRTLFDLATQLATAPAPAAAPDLERITSGKPEWHVLHCPGWPAGIDFPTRDQALDHIRSCGDTNTRLSFWLHQANRVDFTPEQLAEMLADQVNASAAATPTNPISSTEIPA